MEHDLVIDRFRVGERIGSGGMGVVYRAFDERLERWVAVKQIAADDPERVLREAQAAARLNHPGIVTVYELGRRGPEAILVSELVDGHTLDELHALGELTDRDVAEIGSELCDALAHAHARGVVHRDLKPQNLIVRADEGAPGRAKLMDFGIAALAGAPTLTASGEVVGTLAYMAPEQAEGLAAGPPADVYSLALTLYECWTGSNPVAASSPAATARRIGQPVGSLGRERPDLPARLIDVVDACLAVDPGLRPAPEELGRALATVGRQLDHERSVPAPAGAAGPVAPRVRRPRGHLAAALGLAVIVAALAGPAGLPGAALVVGLLAGAALVALPGAGPLMPALAVPLAALGAGGAYPGAAARSGGTGRQRAAASALGWAWALVAAVALGAGPLLGIAPRAPAGWETSTGDAAASVLAPLLEPGSILGAVTFAVAAATLGWILSARHLALAALGALLWAAGLATALGVVGDGALGEQPLLVAAGAAAALALETARRRRAPRLALAREPYAAIELAQGPPAVGAPEAGVRAV